jgi:hypothetical protein
VIFGARELKRRRVGLVARCSEQRASIAAAAGPLTAKAAAADRVLTAVRVHPIIASLAAGALAGLVPRVLPPWFTRLWLLYSLVKRFVG